MSKAPVRIFEVVTELATDNREWARYKVVAASATSAINKVSKKFAVDIEERLVEIKLLASEDFPE